MTELVKTSDAVVQMNALAQSIKQINDVDDITEVRARIEAVKGWAKIHGQTKALRLDLLRLEVLALVRIVELGGADKLGKDREAAEWLASLDEAERERFVRESRTATTAAGMVRAIWRIENLEKEVRWNRAQGRSYGEAPTPPGAYDEDAIKTAHQFVHTVAGALSKTVQYYAPLDGEPFSIEEMAEAVIEDSAVDADLAADPAFVEGVREVCRKAVRDAPPLTMSDIPVPAFITARTAEGNYVRVPTMQATLAHVHEMVELKRVQLAQAAEALEKLERFEDRLRSTPGATDESRVAGLLAASTISAAA